MNDLREDIENYLKLIDSSLKSIAVVVEERAQSLTDRLNSLNEEESNQLRQQLIDTGLIDSINKSIDIINNF